MKKCLLPWSGEFGWYIMIHVRRFHALKGYKIAVCDYGEECLYPTADEIYHFTDTTPDEVKRYGRPIPSILLRDIKRQIVSKHKDIEFIHAAFERKLSKYKKISFKPDSLKKRGIKTDILIAPRFRHGRYESMNYQWWPDIANDLLNDGYITALIGKEETSYPIYDNRLLKSWEIEDNVDCIVDLINNTGVVITSNSGIAHLAILCQAPLVMIGHEGGPALRWMNRQRNHSVPFEARFGAEWFRSREKSINFVKEAVRSLAVASALRGSETQGYSFGDLPL